MPPLNPNAPPSGPPRDISVDDSPKGAFNNFLYYNLLANSDYQVQGYLVTFPTTSDTVSVNCADWAKVGLPHPNKTHPILTQPMITHPMI